MASLPDDNPNTQDVPESQQGSLYESYYVGGYRARVS